MHVFDDEPTLVQLMLSVVRLSPLSVALLIEINITLYAGSFLRCPILPAITLICCSTWWRHQIETYSALLALCEGKSPVTGKFPSQRPVTRICAWINGWVSNREAGYLRRYRTHYNVTVMDTISQAACTGGRDILHQWFFHRNSHTIETDFVAIPGARLTKAYGVTIQRYLTSHAKNTTRQ